MHGTPKKTHNLGKRLTSALSASLLMTLAACGGGGSSDSPIAAPIAEDTIRFPDSADTPTCIADASQTAAAPYFDDIFLGSKGSGYYVFDYNAWASQYSVEAENTGISLVNLSVESTTASRLNQKSKPLTGSGSLSYSKVAYLTPEGAFTSEVLPYDEIGRCSKIFGKFADGYEFGVQGMSQPLFRVTLKPEDISGQRVSDVEQKFQADDDLTTYRMPRLVFPTGDTAAMPQGSTMYAPSYEALTTFLRIDLTTRMEGESLDEMAERIDAIYAIKSLNGHRYARMVELMGFYVPFADRYLVEYDGALYRAELFVPGDRPPRRTDGLSQISPRKAFNTVATRFLVGELGEKPQQVPSKNAPIT